MISLLVACSHDGKSVETQSTDGSDPEADSSSGVFETDTDSDTQPSTDSSEEWDAGVLSFTEVEEADMGKVPFDQEKILEYHLHMDPVLYEEMQEYGDDEVYRVATLTVKGEGIEEQHYPAVGIRYKGDYSLHHCWDEHGGVRSYSNECAKLSSRIKFDEYDEEARFFGLKKINLHAMSEDSTKLRERLAYSIYNEFGVETVRSSHAKLYINDEPPLLVAAVEQVDGRYTALRYPGTGDGNLYKEIWPIDGLSETALKQKLRTNDDPVDNPDVSDFIEFGNAVSGATEETFLDDMAPHTDVTHMLRYMAVDRALKNWDGVTAFYWRDRPHNFYWYKDTAKGSLFQIIPWDMDKTLWEYDPYMDPTNYIADRQVPDWNVLPLSCEPISVWNSNGSVTVIPPGCDNFLHLLAAVLWDDFEVVGQALLDTVFQYDAMNEKVTAWAEQIASAVEEDPLISTSSWERAVEDFRAILQKNIEDFEAHLAAGYIIEE